MTHPVIDGRQRQERVRSTLVYLSRTGELPALPQTATAALAIARDPDADAEALGRVIRTDIALAARVLHVANSAAYARRAPARTLRDAIVALGLRKTCDVLVAACFRQLTTSLGPRAHDLWNHSLAVGLAAEELARSTRTIPPGTGFLPGLFHDVGRIAFVLADPVAAEVIQGLADAGGGERCVLEHDWYGFDHTEAGSTLAADWGLDDEACAAIRWHHDPGNAGDARVLATVLNAADGLAYAIGCGFGAAARIDSTLVDLGLSAEDEAGCLERVQHAFTEESALFA
jgi:HD-like signal output (HDOD) protein